MVCVCLKDGLGNQMFTYAYARAIQEANDDKKLIIDTYDFKNDFRSYALNHFKLNPNIKNNNLINQLWTRISCKLRFNKYLENPIKEEVFNELTKKGLYYDYFPYGKHEPMTTKARKKVVRGCYQCSENFESIKDIIIDEFTVVTPPSPENKQMLEQISKDNAVCVHVRRGDYINHPVWSKELAICTEEYYKKAMDIVASKVENPVFYIFSNCSEDIKWIKENYKFDYDVKYVDLNNPDYEELRLMYSCKHFIISNSTFSWWAQYLSKNENKVVVAPSLWNRSVNASNIYMDSWEIVDVK